MLEGENVAEYLQEWRTLYLEAQPRADEATRDAALKQKFEEGLHSGDMLQFLRIHARQDNFGQTGKYLIKDCIAATVRKRLARSSQPTVYSHISKAYTGYLDIYTGYFG